MKSVRTDLIIISILMSLAAHFAIMYYVKPVVMTRVVKGEARMHHRGPMKVSETKEIPPPVEIDTVKDVEPDKDAPEADETMALAPKLDAQLPTDQGDLSVPEVELPEISSAEIPVEKLPEVLSSDFSPIVRPVEKMITDQDLATAPEEIVHIPSDMPADFSAAPVFGVPELSLGDVSTTQAEDSALAELSKKERKDENEPEFIPAPEVLAGVDEGVVEAEKGAVRDLVDALDAANLADYVDVELVRTSAEDGEFFRVTITPKETLKTVPKDVVVLIDASGSIGRDRMVSIRSAAKRILRSAANTGDRFNLVAFRDKFSYAFKTWQDCDVRSFDAADRWLNNVAPFGRTDVFKTIRSILTLPRDPTRPLIALVVTDGDANSGVSNTAQILSKFSKLNDGLVSVYMYGVKSSANRELIEVLTQGNRGESFIFEESGWGSSTRAGSGIEPLSKRFRDPVLSDLRIVFASDCAATCFPRLLKNLYAGGSVVFHGRVPNGTKEIAFSLKGLNGKDAYESFFRLSLEDAKTDGSIRQKWVDAHLIDNKLR